MSYAIIKNGQKNIVAGRVAPIVDRYSTDEVKTDKVWIDGKPIYRKCYNLGSVSVTTTATEVALDTIADIDTLLWSESSFNNSLNNRHIIHNPTGTQWIKVLMDSNKAIKYSKKADSNQTFTNCIAIIEYTKN